MALGTDLLVNSTEKHLADSGAPARRGPLVREHGSTAYVTRVVVHAVTRAAEAHTCRY